MLTVRLVNWLIRQNYRFSVGQAKIPNPLEVAIVTYFALLAGAIAAASSYACIWAFAWVLGYLLQKYGFVQYEQKYISELNPVLMEIRKARVEKKGD